MKRFNLSVVLEDNEALAEEVKKVVEAQSKQIAREIIDTTLTEEITRIVHSKVNSLGTAGHWSPVFKHINETVSKVIDNKLKSDGTLNEMIDTLISQKVESLVEQRLKKDVDLDEIIEGYLNKSIASALLSRSNAEG